MTTIPEPEKGNSADKHDESPRRLVLSLSRDAVDAQADHKKHKSDCSLSKRGRCPLVSLWATIILETRSFLGSIESHPPLSKGASMARI